MTKKTFSISGMHCVSCAMNIDGELEDTEGIKSSSTNFAKATTEVEFDEKEVTLDKIINLIKQTGYKAQIKKE